MNSTLLTHRRDLYVQSRSLELSVLKMVTFTAILHREGDMYVAECPEVGTVSQGATAEEAVDNLRDATELYLDEFPLEGSDVDEFDFAHYL